MSDAAIIVLSKLGGILIVFLGVYLLGGKFAVAQFIMRHDHTTSRSNRPEDETKDL